MDAAWLGAEGEESVNPVFLGDVTAVFREEENALLCSQGLGEVSPGRMVGMRRGVEISCLAWARRETAAISMPPMVCCPEPALALKMSPHLAQALAKLGKPQGPRHTCCVGRVCRGSCLTRAWPSSGKLQGSQHWHPSSQCVTGHPRVLVLLAGTCGLAVPVVH